MKKIQLDKIDRKILNMLSEDARISNAEIAKKLKMVPSGILKRIRNLEEAGVIKRYETRIDHKKVGLNMSALIMIQTNENIGVNKVGGELAKLREVQEIHYLTGEFCYLMKVRVKDTDALSLFLEKVGKIKNVRDSRTTLILKTIKETIELNL